MDCCKILQNFISNPVIQMLCPNFFPHVLSSVFISTLLPPYVFLFCSCFFPLYFLECFPSLCFLLPAFLSLLGPPFFPSLCIFSSFVVFFTLSFLPFFIFLFLPHILSYFLQTVLPCSSSFFPSNTHSQ